MQLQISSPCLASLILFHFAKKKLIDLSKIPEFHMLENVQMTHYPANVRLKLGVSKALLYTTSRHENKFKILFLIRVEPLIFTATKPCRWNSLKKFIPGGKAKHQSMRNMSNLFVYTIFVAMKLALRV